MTRNGIFCAALAVIFTILSFICALWADTGGFLGAWFVAVSVVLGMAAFSCTFTAVGDYLMENEG